MNFRITMKTFFYFVLCLRLSSSMHLFPRTDTLPKENLLEKFFIDLKTAYLSLNEPRHVTIVSTSNNNLQRAESLFKSYPYIICKAIEKCRYSKWFSRGNFVVVFLDNLGEDTLKKNIELLSLCKLCRVLFISNATRLHTNEIRLIFTLAVEKNMQYIEFAHLMENEINLYSNFLGKNCSVEIRLVKVWSPGIPLDDINSWAFRLMENFNGCPIAISSLTFKPKIWIAERSNDSLVIVGGREGKLLLEIAEKLNFTMNLKYPSVVDRMKYSRKMAIIKDVIAGIADVGIGRLLPTNGIHDQVSFSIPYDTECVTWGVPLELSLSNDIVWVEFSWQVWILVGLVFVVACFIGYAEELLKLPKRGRKPNIGLVKIVLDVLAVDLGNPVVYIPFSSGGRFLLMIYLYYGVVITTAYKSYLSAILSTNEVTPMFDSVEEIIKNAHIILGGSLYDYNILEDQVNESKLTSKILERFVINNNDTQSMLKLKYDHNYAFIARLSSLNYQKLIMIRDREVITFDTLDNCVLAYPTVIFFKKASILRLQTDNIIRNLLETGLLDHWDHEEIVYTDKIFKSGNSGKYFESHTVHKFWILFRFYFACNVLCILVFFIEIGTG